MEKGKSESYDIIQQSHSWVYMGKNMVRMSARVLTAALSPTAKTWKRPKRPLTDEWIKKDVVHIYNGILLSC